MVIKQAISKFKHQFAIITVISVAGNITERDTFPPVVPNSRATFVKELKKGWDFKNLVIRQNIEDNISITSLMVKDNSRPQIITIRAYSKMASRMGMALREQTNTNI